MSSTAAGTEQPPQDRWANWVLHARHGDDEGVRADVELQLARIRDAVLRHAAIAPGDTVLDVGTGDGLIGLGAASLVSPGGKVIFSDVSEALLEHVRGIAGSGPHRYVLARAEDLSEIGSGTVDVVTVRSVLIYVEEKRRAMRELFRVLAPGGRLSLCEPINRRMCDPDRYGEYEISAIRELVDRLAGPSACSDHADPMTDFDESTLLSLAEEVGFAEVHLRLEVDVEHSTTPMPWDAFVNSAFNPNAPTLAEAMGRELSDDERDRVEHHLRPLVERGEGVRRVALAYLWGCAPDR